MSSPIHFFNFLASIIEILMGWVTSMLLTLFTMLIGLRDPVKITLALFIILVFLMAIYFALASAIRRRRHR